MSLKARQTQNQQNITKNGGGCKGCANVTQEKKILNRSGHHKLRDKNNHAQTHIHSQIHTHPQNIKYNIPKQEIQHSSITPLDTVGKGDQATRYHTQAGRDKVETAGSKL